VCLTMRCCEVNKFFSLFASEMPKDGNREDDEDWWISVVTGSCPFWLIVFFILHVLQTVTASLLPHPYYLCLKSRLVVPVNTILLNITSGTCNLCTMYIKRGIWVHYRIPKYLKQWSSCFTLQLFLTKCSRDSFLDEFWKPYTSFMSYCMSVCDSAQNTQLILIKLGMVD